MKAAVQHEFGGAPRFADHDPPAATEGSVEVEVELAGLNPVDLVISTGKFYGMKPELPSIPGREGVGLLSDGTVVFFPRCTAPFGAFAERALVPAEAIVPLSEAMEPAVAVSLWTSGLAAWMPFEDSARLQPGESVLVLGSSGVVGQLAIQLARLKGAGRVVAAARSETGRERAATLEADDVLPLADVHEFETALANRHPDGFDVVLDLVFGDPAAVCIEHLANNGRLVQVGSASGPVISVSAATLKTNNISLIGYSNANVDHGTLSRAYRQMLQYAADGALRIEHEIIPLARVDEAWKAQAEGPHRKLLLRP